MSDAPSPTPDRIRLRAEADEFFRDADVADRGARHDPAFFWETMEEAAHMFNAAAWKYREAGLGAKARQAYTRAAECHREMAKEQEHYARLCEQDREKILVAEIEDEDASEGNEETRTQ
jgi:hypothetical protein